MRSQAAAGDIVLLFADESEVSTHPYLAHQWARRGEDLRVAAPGQAKKRALLGVRDAADGHLSVILRPTKRSADFIQLLEIIDQRYHLGPDYGGPPVVLVLDNGAIHTSRATHQALDERTWLRVEWLPKYASELNDIERDWRVLKRHYLANQSFTDLDHLDRLTLQAISDMNRRRSASSCASLIKAA